VIRLEYTEVMVRYGELSTKGKNRRDFIAKLADNIQKAYEVMDQRKAIKSLLVF